MFRENFINIILNAYSEQEQAFNIHKVKGPEDNNMNNGREQTVKDIFQENFPVRKEDEFTN